MKVRCPHCGKMVVMNTGGRKTLNMSVILLCDRIRGHPTAEAAAKSLGISKGSLFKQLKETNLTLKQAREGRT